MNRHIIVRNREVERLDGDVRITSKAAPEEAGVDLENVVTDMTFAQQAPEEEEEDGGDGR
mgnify:CR=1 FL=1